MILLVIGWILLVMIAVMAMHTMTGKDEVPIVEKKEPVIDKSSPVDNLNTIIEYNSKKYGVPIPLIKAIIMNESSWRIYVKNPNDPSYGLMGIMAQAAQDYGLVKDWRNPTIEEINSIYIPANNIGAGCKLLSGLLKRNSMWIAVECYNVGERGYHELGRRNGSYVSKVKNDYYNTYCGV